MPSKWVPNAAETAPDSHDVNFGFCPANSQLYRLTVKPPRRNAAIACRRVPGRHFAGLGRRPVSANRRSPPEDGTDFSSYAAGASPDIPWCDCRGVVVAGHADHAWRARRSTPTPSCTACPMRRSAASRPRWSPTTHISAEQIAEDLAQLAKVTDCVRTYSIENGLDQVPALAAKVGLEGHPGHLARQQPAEEPRADLDRGPARQGVSRRHHLDRRRQRGAAARRDDGRRSRRQHPLGEGAGHGARDLCRRLGILAEEPRGL